MRSNTNNQISIDASHTNGEWVDESAYNRNNQTNASVLSGNWVEERFLKEEREKLADAGANVPDSTQKSEKSFKPTSTIAITKDFTGKTTSFFMDSQGATQPSRKNEHTNLVFSADPVNDREHFNKTTNRVTYQPHRPTQSAKKGAREQLLERQLYIQAIDDKTKEIEQEEEQYHHTMKSILTTTYKSDHCHRAQDDQDLTQTVRNQALTRSLFAENREKYDKDAPITVYSDAIRNNTQTDALKTQIYHTATTGRNPFAKNATFSTPITEFKKDTTKI